MSRNRWIIVAVSFAAMIGISVYVVRGAMGKHGTLPMLPWWSHALAFGFVLLEALSRSIKIQWGAHAMHIPMGYGLAVRTSLGGDFASSLTPSRSGAEPARFLVLAESRMPTASIILVLFLELLMEAVTFLVIGLIAWFVFDGSMKVLWLMATIVVGYIALLFGIGAFGVVLTRRNTKGPPPKWTRTFGLHAGHWRGVQRSLRHLRSSLAALRHANLIKLTQSFLASMVHVSAKLAILPAIVWSIDSSAELSNMILYPLLLFYGATIAPAPGGGGAVEYGFKESFEGILAPPVLASALIWWRFYTLYMYIILGALAGGATVLRAVGSDKKKSPAG
jgi:uncharacterized protein (TIRG00374 family)